MKRHGVASAELGWADGDVSAPRAEGGDLIMNTDKVRWNIKRTLVLAFAICLFLTGCMTAVVATGVGAVAVVALMPGEPVWKTEAFAAEFHRAAMPAEGEGNVAISPYSVASVLALTYTGATNATAKAMATALSLEDRGIDVANVFQRINRALVAAGSDDVELTHGLSVWPREGLTLNPIFIQTAHTGFDSDVVPVQMNETGREKINAFVRRQTHGMVKTIIPPPLTDSTSMILVSTLYFKGKWARPFPRAKTMPGTFHAPDGDVKATFMGDVGAFRHADCGDYTALYLPYRGGAVEMVVLLPREAYGMEALTRAYGPVLLRAIDEAASEKQVGVTFPIFSVSTSLDLKDALIGMGMGPAFSDHAEFSGIATDAPLKISRVLHQVRVDVGEEGTEAAAATAVMMTRSAMLPRPPQVEFMADRPFLFLIREVTTGVILFSGRLECPAGVGDQEGDHGE